MLQRSTTAFMEALKQNNHKEWFDQNKSDYETAKKDFYQFVEILLKGISEQDEDIARANLRVKDCVFRINRDIRFSKDKTPYKTNWACHFKIGDKKKIAAGYYMHLEKEGYFIGGGIWMPDSPSLRRIREEIDYAGENLEKILHDKDFLEFFPKGFDQEDVLKKAPKGFKEENPYIQYLKQKSFTVSHSFPEELVYTPEISDYALKVFKAMHPFIKFLNNSFDD